MTTRRKYDKEFKLDAVRIVEDGKRIAEVGRELNLAEQTLHNWVKKFKEDKDDAFVGSSNLKPEDKTVRDLQIKIT
ncbi:transposase [Bacillus sp. REN16]|nr:transposase [Bacillus sp. REN16]MCC3358988.1 transposase [Bacillus sp. REN16]